MKKIVLGVFLFLAAVCASFADTVIVDSFTYFNESVAEAVTPRTIELSTSIIADSAFNYQGADDLTIFGNGFFIDGAGFGLFVSTGIGKSITFSSVTLLGFANSVAADSDSYSYGGALYAGGFANIFDAVFTSNTAIAYITSGTAVAYGGAIYNAGTTTITNSYFAFNTAVSSGGGQAFGGAIYNANGSTLYVVANGTNTVFEGNFANGSRNAIYNSSEALIYLNAAAGSSIIFNDAINGNAQAGVHGAVHINSNTNSLPYGGDVVLNNSLIANDIYLYSGTLKVGLFNGVSYYDNVAETTVTVIAGSRGSIGASGLENRGTLFLGNGSVLDMANGVTGDTVYISTLTVDGTAKVNIDVDLASARDGYVRNLDIIEFPNLNTDGTGTLDFRGIKIISDFTSGITTNFQVFRYDPATDLLAGTPDFYTNRGSATYYVTRFSSSIFNITLESYNPDVFQNFVSTQTGNRVYWSSSSYYTPLLYSGVVNDGELWINGGTDASSKTFSINGANINRIFNINSDNVVLEINDITLSNGLSPAGSAILNSSGTVRLSNVTFQSNVAKSTEEISYVGGGALYNSSYTYIVNSAFNGNSAAGIAFGTAVVSAYGGAIYNDVGAELTIIDTSFKDNSVSGSGSLGGAIYNAGEINIITAGRNSEFEQNSAQGVSNAIHNAGHATLNLNAGAGDIIFRSNITSSGNANIININASSTSVAGAPVNGNVLIAADMSGFGNINGEIGNTVNFYAGTLSVDKGAVLFENAQFNMYAGSRLNLQNGSFDSVKFSDFNLSGSGDAFVGIDVNLHTRQSDNFVGSVLTAGGANFVIDKISILEDAGNLDKVVNILIADNANLQNSITLSDGVKKLMGPIFVYDVSYNNGTLSFAYTQDFNPAVFIVPVTMYVGGYVEQLNSYKQTFDVVENRALEKTQSSFWIRPYGYREEINLYKNLKVTHETYGAFIGYDTPESELSGLNLAFSIFGGLNSSSQKYDGAHIDQIGGIAGATAVLYGENFWTALSANLGVTSEHGEGSYGTETFMMYTKGIASKTGYTFSLDFDNKYKLVPALMLAASFIDMAPFGEDQNVTVTSDGVYPITVEPSVKFLADVSEDFSAYVNLNFVYSILNDPNFKANHVILPNFSIDPYVQYGFGCVKKLSDIVSARAEVFGISGGRSGVGGQLNVQFKLGGGSENN
ncbi:beta strand repeat-containing protein [Endomicrobium proavitum]|uniref:Autotransporter domain-containing protein n=1 Tax=Endomicrobium proavitum TaxID=1408281 RepID=A0A0G3WFY2_9BACT|nr:hypothetical protein [Endomicrobium proavitum]AKL97526.1 membrane protein of unknown function [Endomicrobium proavitum]